MHLDDTSGQFKFVKSSPSRLSMYIHPYLGT